MTLDKQGQALVDASPAALAAAVAESKDAQSQCAPLVLLACCGSFIRVMRTASQGKLALWCATLSSRLVVSSLESCLVCMCLNQPCVASGCRSSDCLRVADSKPAANQCTARRCTCWLLSRTDLACACHQRRKLAKTDDQSLSLRRQVLFLSAAAALLTRMVAPSSRACCN